MTMNVRFVTANEATTDIPLEVCVNEHFIGYWASMVKILVQKLSDAGICLDDNEGAGI